MSTSSSVTHPLTSAASSWPTATSTSTRKRRRLDPSISISKSRTNTSHTRRPATAATTATNPYAQEIIVAISESRGISPIVGLAILNLSSAEAVLCQICDTQTYVRILHKLSVFGPTEILFANTAQGSNLLGAVRENLVKTSDDDILFTPIDRKYWNEGSGFDYLKQLALPEDMEALKVSLEGNYYAASCFSAVMKYVELAMSKTFAFQSLRIKFEPSQGSALIDLSTIASLELIQNLQNAKSKHSLLGLLNETLTIMGSRIIKSNILQPLTDTDILQARYEAVEELTTKEQMFHSIRDALRGLVDTDRVLSQLVLVPTKINFQHAEQSVNTVVQLKTFVDMIKHIWQALAGATSNMLEKIRSLCSPLRFESVQNLIQETLNADVAYSTQPLELRNQRTYAIKAGVNGFLDVARQTYKEANEDAFALVNDLSDPLEISLDIKYEPARGFYIRISYSSLGDRRLPDIFINVFRKKAYVECQTLDLVKINQRITDAHNEVIKMSDTAIQDLIQRVRTEITPLFKISESIALLDMLAAFAQVATVQDYVKPEITPALAIKSGRHPILESINRSVRFVTNDVYATPQSRFQIVTGCNMSGKSTYIRSIALMTIMAQVGCFVPATYASFPITHQIFARVSTDDNIESNVSTFSSEMREMSFILANIEPRSLILVDELGRGTSTTDGLAIAIAIAEALISSGALVWFITHFRELPRILSERSGVVNLHLAVDLTPERMNMLYKISDGPEEEKFYGLSLAKVVDLPADIILVAEGVSKALNKKADAKKSDQRALAVAKRRKLVLSLKEQLAQARDGQLAAEDLKAWLKGLQDELAVRLMGIEIEEKVAQAGGAFEELQETKSSSSEEDRSSFSSRSVIEDGSRPTTSIAISSTTTTGINSSVKAPADGKHNGDEQVPLS